MRAVALALVALAFGACSDGESSETSGNAGELWEQYCHAEATRRAGCAESFDLDACLEDRACIEGVYRPDVVAPLTRCLRERACGQGDDACFDSAGALHGSDPDVRAYESACVERQDECELTGTSFSDDFCGGTGLALPVVHRELTPCLSRPCDQIEDCLRGVLEARGC
jgi:hypothetical protein